MAVLGRSRLTDEMAEARSHQQDALQHIEAEVGVNGISVGLAQTASTRSVGDMRQGLSRLGVRFFLNSEVPPSAGDGCASLASERIDEARLKLTSGCGPPVRLSYRSAAQAGGVTQR